MTKYIISGIEYENDIGNVDIFHINHFTHIDDLEQKTSELLQQIGNEIQTIVINGKGHTSNISRLPSILGEECFLQKQGLQASGVDGYITYSEDSSILPPTTIGLSTAGCGNIGIFSEQQDMMGMIHAGHMGVADNILEKLVVGIQNLKGKDYIDTLTFYGGPMVGKKYEFSTLDCVNNFGSLCQKHGLDIKKYFTEKTECTGYLDLRSLIRDIFISLGVKQDRVIFSPINTNNPDNYFSDYRIFSVQERIFKQIKKLLGIDTIKEVKEKYLQFDLESRKEILTKLELSNFEQSITESPTFGRREDTRLLSLITNVGEQVKENLRK